MTTFGRVGWSLGGAQHAAKSGIGFWHPPPRARAARAGGGACARPDDVRAVGGQPSGSSLCQSGFGNAPAKKAAKGLFHAKNEFVVKIMEMLEST